MPTQDRPAEPLLPSRRDLLARMGAGFGLLGLAGMLSPTLRSEERPASAPGPHFAPRAKRVIFLFMNGGPSHVDTLDPKPALAKFTGDKPADKELRKSKSTGFMPSPFRFERHGRSGIEVSELLPGIAGVIDDLCVVRSMRTTVPNHEPGLLMMNCGNLQPIRPSLGSWLLYGLGTENNDLPGFVVLRPSDRIVVGPALWSNAFLPARYQATSVITSDTRVDRMLANIQNPTITRTEQRRQLDLLAHLNRRHLDQRGGDGELDAQIQAMETAFRMQSEAMDAFDISREPPAVSEAYGDTPFGRSCLLARRLVESGVRMVQVYYVSKGNNQPWDTHKQNDDGHRKLCADSDRATTALLRDLKARGLLEDTLVVWGGEFGRTPYSQVSDDKTDRSSLGRDHHHTAFSMILAGGGVRGGMVHGASDELGMTVAESPVHVH
ncbi:MAG TPA: DUF1501 domain-containing protein, partial [Planctomycetota bacterium]|nr:DUF1501 domain-containing protein [Planctomycetota bacterium]